MKPLTFAGFLFLSTLISSRKCATYSESNGDENLDSLYMIYTCMGKKWKELLGSILIEKVKQLLWSHIHQQKC